MNSTAIIVPNWNGLAEIEACLTSLAQQSLLVTIVVVDNGSTDGSKELIEQKYPEVVVLPQPRNLGFAGGVNVGIRYALEQHHKYIGLFNSDAAADKDWAKYLVDVLSTNRDAGIATGLLLHGDGKTIDSTGDWYSIWGLPFPRGRGIETANADAAGPVFSGSGGASVYRSELFEKIGLFDDTFFAYYEDVDISFRAQLAGYSVFYEPRALAYHERGSASTRMQSTSRTATTKISGFTVFQTFKNLPLLCIKDVPASLLPIVFPRFFIAYILMLGNAIRHGNGGAAIKGGCKSLLLLPHALRERHHIQGMRKVSKTYIRSILWSDLPPDQTGLRKVRKFFTGKP